MTNIVSPPEYLDDILFNITHYHLGNLVPKHSHSCSEIVLIVGGTAVETVGGVANRVYPGCVTVIHPGICHEYSDIQDCELFNIACAPELFKSMGVKLSFLQNREALFNSTSDSFKLRLSGLLFSDVHTLLSRMYRMFVDKKAVDRQVELRSLFSMLLILLVQAWTPPSTPRSPALTAALELMDNCFNQKLTLDQLARLSCMSPNVFLRRFRTETGKSPRQYLIDLRLCHARSLLNDSDLSIDQIALSCGFYDANYLVKMYKRRYKITPGQQNKTRARILK